MTDDISIDQDGIIHYVDGKGHNCAFFTDPQKLQETIQQVTAGQEKILDIFSAIHEWFAVLKQAGCHPNTAVGFLAPQLATILKHYLTVDGD